MLSYDLVMGSEPENSRYGVSRAGGQEAVEISENRHTFLHSYTFVVLDGNAVEREISC